MTTELELASLADRVEGLENALRPFITHIGKSGAQVTLKIGKDTWTGTLTTAHFEAAYDVYMMKHESYRGWKADRARSIQGKE